MATSTEELILKISGDSKSAEETLARVGKAWSDMGRQLDSMTASGQKVSSSLKSQFAELGQALRTGRDQISGFAGDVKGFGETITSSIAVEQIARAGAALQTIFGGIASTGKNLIMSSMDIASGNQMLGLSMQVAGENAGYSTAQLQATEKAIEKLGITTSNATQAVTSFIQGQLDMSKATDLARASQDLAVNANENSSQTFGVLTQAILSMQPELLRRYGIVATMDQILGDLATSTDVAAKRQQFMNFVLKESGKFTGLYERSLELAGKKMSSLPRYIEQAKAAFGEAFLPIQALFADTAKEILKFFTSLPKGTIQVISVLAGLVTAVAAAGVAFGGLLAILPTLLAGFRALTGLKAISTLMTAVGGSLLPIIAIVVAVAAAIGLFYLAWTNNWGGIRTAIQNAWAKIAPLLQNLQTLVTQWGAVFALQAQQIWTALQKIWQAVVTFLQPAFTWMSEQINRIDWSVLTAGLSDTINVLSGLISALLDGIRGLLSGEGMSAFNPLADALTNVLTLMALAWQGFISGALTWGVQLVMNIVNGITSSVGQFVGQFSESFAQIETEFNTLISNALIWGYNLVISLANGVVSGAGALGNAVVSVINSAISPFLEAFSPPKEGPLSQIAQWGKGVMDSYLRAFKTADFGLLTDMMSPIQDALDQAVSSGSLNQADMLTLFSSVRTQVAGLVADFRKTGVVSKQAFDKIAASLGPGSDELMKYLQLTLDLEKANREVSTIEDDLAKKRAGGTATAADTARLIAAKKNQASIKDQLDWQKQFMAAQKDSVSLQLRMIQALEALAKAQEKVTKAAKTPKAGGVTPITPTGPSGGGLGLPYDSRALDEGLREQTTTLGKMSSVFDDMKRKVQEFLALPLGEKLAQMWTGFADAVLKPLGTTWARVMAVWKMNWNSLRLIVWMIWPYIQGVITGKINEIKNGIANWLASLAATWRTNFELLKTIAVAKWEQVRAGIVAKITEIKTGIATKIAEIRASVTSKWNEITAPIARAWETVRAAVVTKITEIKTGIAAKIAEIRASVTSKWNEITAPITRAWETVRAAVVTKITEIKTGIETKISEIRAALTLENLFAKMGLDLETMKARWSAIWNDVVLIVTTIWERIKTSISTKVAEIVGPVLAKVAEIKAGLDAKWAEVSLSVSTWWTGIVTTVTTKATEIYNAATGKVAEIKAGLDAKWAEISLSVSTWWAGIVTSVTTKVQEIYNAATGKVAEIKAGLDAKWSEVSLAVSTWWTGIVTTVTAKALEIWTAITGKVSEIKGSLDATWLEISTSIASWWGGIVTSVTTKAQEIYNSVTGKISEISGWITTNIASFIKAGADIVQGIIDGVLQNAGKLVEAITKLAEDALKGIKDKLGIQSPSTVFSGIGDNLVQGLANGVTAGRNLVADAMSGIWSALTGGAGAQNVEAPVIALPDMAAMLGSVTSVMGTISSMWAQLWLDIPLAMTNAWIMLQTLLTLNATIWTAIWQTFLAQMLTTWTASWAAVNAVLSEIWIVMKTTVLDPMVQILTDIATLLATTIVAAATAMAEYFSGDFTKWWGEFKTAVLDPMGAAFDYILVRLYGIEGAAQDAIDAIRRLMGKMEELNSAPPVGGAGSTPPGYALGSTKPTAAGLVFLHANEWVLSQAMRAGSQPIPAGALSQGALNKLVGQPLILAPSQASPIQISIGQVSSDLDIEALAYRVFEVQKRRGRA